MAMEHVLYTQQLCHFAVPTVSDSHKQLQREVVTLWDLICGKKLMHLSCFCPAIET